MTQIVLVAVFVIVVVIVGIAPGVWRSRYPAQAAKSPRLQVNWSLLKQGASFSGHAAPDGGGWLPIQTAPHDGTVVETKNSYGVAPTYGLFRWQDHWTGPNGEQWPQKPSWTSVADSSSGLDGEGAWLQWRPFQGDPKSYVDPTQGAQDTPEYWRGAIAAKEGRRLDFFEQRAAGGEARTR